MSVNHFSSEEKKAILQHIKAAELDTSGEIRVHIENHCNKDVFERGVELLFRLNMHKTAQRNGVLFYLAMADKKFSIVADEGINNVVPADFWDATKAQMSSLFKMGEFVNGICYGIDQAGKELKAHFPYHSDDRNELSDEISFGEN